jgi:hypothetical protein
MLLTVHTALSKELLGSKSWASEHFEAYVQYLNKRPFIRYALGYLKRHLHECGEVTGIPQLVSQLREQATNTPTSYLLGSWAAPDWVQTADYEQRSYSKEFRNRLEQVMHGSSGTLETEQCKRETKSETGAIKTGQGRAGKGLLHNQRLQPNPQYIATKRYLLPESGEPRDRWGLEALTGPRRRWKQLRPAQGWTEQR